MFGFNRKGTNSFSTNSRILTSIERIPVMVRMILYSVPTLALFLVGLPWLAYRLDVYYPVCHIEIGSLRIIGAVLLVIVVVAYIYCSSILSSRGKGPFVEFDPPREFVSSGPYRWVRNPIVVCVLGMMLASALTWSSTGIFLLFLLTILFTNLQVIILEEPLLRKRFGQEYEEYLKNVPRWIPRRPKKKQNKPLRIYSLRIKKKKF